MSGGGGGDDKRWCLASDERRRFLSRLLSALVSSPSPSSSLLADDADVCWAGLEIEAAVASGEEESEGGKEAAGTFRRDWPRARAHA